MRDADKTPREIRYEFPDPTPIEAPVPSRPAPNTLAKLLQEQRIAAALNAQLADETFEESDDFDIEDDPVDPQTPWEIAADAAAMTPAELFERVYGITREEAMQRLHHLEKQMGEGTPQPDLAAPPAPTGSGGNNASGATQPRTTRRRTPPQAETQDE